MIGLDSTERIHGVGPSRFSSLFHCGIKTIEQLANIDDISNISMSSGLSEKYLRKLQLQAKSIISSEVYQIAPFNLQKEKLIFYDIETDINRQRVWLIGILKDNIFTPLFAENWDQEKNFFLSL